MRGIKAWHAASRMMSALPIVSIHLHQGGLVQALLLLLVLPLADAPVLALEFAMALLVLVLTEFEFEPVRAPGPEVAPPLPEAEAAGVTESIEVPA